MAARALIYETGHELLDFMFGGRQGAERVIGKLFKKSLGHFSHAHATKAVLDGQVVGIEVGYRGEVLAAEEFRGGLSLFLASPPSQWWRLVRTVDPTLSEYVPKPRENTYYINNIATDGDVRGLGLGKQLLQSAIERARAAGCDAVELDVTAINSGAIGFYKKHGFVEMFTSGSDELEEAHGLPRLIRMRHDLVPIAERHRRSFDLNTANPLVVNDVTGLNPTPVGAVIAPSSVEQLQRVISNTSGPISIGGGRFSMGGQTASPESLHVDMRGMNRILEIDPEARTIRAESGTRWRDIQAAIDEYDLSIKIMQTYANFTLGGSISVNCHGRYIGLGPLILSILDIDVMLHDGQVIRASPKKNKTIFYGVVGGYGALGIILAARLSLAENKRVRRLRKKIDTSDYLAHFRDDVRDADGVVFHNADLFPPNFARASSVTWVETDRPVTKKSRLKPRRRLYLLEKYIMWAITETPFGKWRREHLLEPLFYAFDAVHWRNYEAGYDVEELEPLLKDRYTYVLQEYFVATDKFDEFVAASREILNRHRVNVVNISIRHAYADTGSYLSWARQECFAFVLYYKQGTDADETANIEVWTRELIQAAIDLGGAYYLPYQPHATPAQFRQAYPDAKKLFTAKRRLDPDNRFRNALWEKYYAADAEDAEEGASNGSEFRAIYEDDDWRDKFYLFLQNIYRIYPENRFHALIKQACGAQETDRDIYRHVQRGLPGIKPFLSELTLAVPALAKQKREIAAQVSRILDGNRSVEGYLEIGSTGRYVKPLSKILDIEGPIYLTNDVAPDFSPPEILERGQVPKIGTFFPLDDYAPIPADVIPDDSLDLVTCFIGLHHCAPDRLRDYIASIARVLRDGGTFVLRDHDAADDAMITFVSLVHTVFNAGLDVPWAQNEAEPRHFAGIDHWVDALQSAGFVDEGHRLLQDHDPSKNTLMSFTLET